MPQIMLPVFPPGMSFINDLLAFHFEDDNITYYNMMMPIFTHHKDDIPTFRMILSQFYVNGNATQAELIKAFAIPSITLKRAVKLYREKGPKGFFEPSKRGGARVITEDVVTEVERLLDEGHEVSEVANKLGLKKDTLNKAIKSGKIKKKSLTTEIVKN